MSGAEARVSLEERLRHIGDGFGNLPPVSWMAEKLGVQPLAIAGAGLVWLFGFFLWGFTSELICSVVGLLYPGYASFRALDDGDASEVHAWLAYWITFATVSLCEGVFRRALFWLPFYHVIRLAFMVWLFFPASGGAQIVYRWAIAPLLRRHRKTVDAALAKSVQELQSSLYSDEVKAAFCSAAANGAMRACELGGTEFMQELMAKELAKTARAGYEKVVLRAPTPNRKEDFADCLTGSPGKLGSRTRNASPRPAFLPATAEEESH